MVCFVQPPNGRRTSGEEIVTNRFLSCAGYGAALVAFTLAAAPAAHAQGKWRAGAPIPQGANEVIGAAVDGQIYVYGGQDASMTPQGLFFKYEPAKDQWTKLASNPLPVHHSSAASVGRKFYVMGGFRLPTTGKVGWYPENKAWAYDLDSGQWSALPPM